MTWFSKLTGIEEESPQQVRRELAVEGDQIVCPDEAAYEATLLSAVINVSRSGVHIVYLTLLGGGVFGNDDAWILNAIERAFLKTNSHGLDVRIVSYRQSRPMVVELCNRIA